MIPAAILISAGLMPNLGPPVAPLTDAARTYWPLALVAVGTLVLVRSLVPGRRTQA